MKDGVTQNHICGFGVFLKWLYSPTMHSLRGRQVKPDNQKCQNPEIETRKIARIWGGGGIRNPQREGVPSLLISSVDIEFCRYIGDQEGLRLIQ